jgi:dTDP-glucose pyrophosphorylase
MLLRSPSNYAITGAYFFKPVVFDMIKQLEGGIRDNRCDTPGDTKWV